MAEKLQHRFTIEKKMALRNSKGATEYFNSKRKVELSLIGQKKQTIQQPYRNIIFKNEISMLHKQHAASTNIKHISPKSIFKGPRVSSFQSVNGYFHNKTKSINKIKKQKQLDEKEPLLERGSIKKMQTTFEIHTTTKPQVTNIKEPSQTDLMLVKFQGNVFNNPSNGNQSYSEEPLAESTDKAIKEYSHQNPYSGTNVWPQTQKDLTVNKKLKMEYLSLFLSKNKTLDQNKIITKEVEAHNPAKKKDSIEKPPKDRNAQKLPKDLLPSYEMKVARIPNSTEKVNVSIQAVKPLFLIESVIKHEKSHSEGIFATAISKQLFWYNKSISPTPSSLKSLSSSSVVHQLLAQTSNYESHDTAWNGTNFLHTLTSKLTEKHSNNIFLSYDNTSSENIFNTQEKLQKASIISPIKKPDIYNFEHPVLKSLTKLVNELVRNETNTATSLVRMKNYIEKLKEVLDDETDAKIEEEKDLYKSTEKINQNSLQMHHILEKLHKIMKSVADLQKEEAKNYPIQNQDNSSTWPKEKDIPLNVSRPIKKIHKNLNHHTKKLTAQPTKQNSSEDERKSNSSDQHYSKEIQATLLYIINRLNHIEENILIPTAKIKTHLNLSKTDAFGKEITKNAKVLSPIFLKKTVPLFKEISHKLSINQKEFANLKMKCNSNFTFYRNQRLKGSFRSGLFSLRGVVSNIEDCVKACCQLDNCNVAYIRETLCFTIQCSNTALCVPVANKSPKDQSMLIFLKRKSGTRNFFDESEITLSDPDSELFPAVSAWNSKPEPGPGPRPGIQNKVKLKTTPHSNTYVNSARCQRSNILYGHMLKGKWEAGDYIKRESAKSINECRNLCCKWSECHVALFVTDCYNVKCKSRENCIPVPSPFPSYMDKFEQPKLAVIRLFNQNKSKIKLTRQHPSISSITSVMGVNEGEKPIENKKIALERPTDSLKTQKNPVLNTTAVYKRKSQIETDTTSMNQLEELESMSEDIKNNENIAQAQNNLLPHIREMFLPIKGETATIYSFQKPETRLKLSNKSVKKNLKNLRTKLKSINTLSDAVPELSIVTDDNAYELPLEKIMGFSSPSENSNDEEFKKMSTTHSEPTDAPKELQSKYFVQNHFADLNIKPTYGHEKFLQNIDENNPDISYVHHQERNQNEVPDPQKSNPIVVYIDPGDERSSGLDEDIPEVPKVESLSNGSKFSEFPISLLNTSATSNQTDEEFKNYLNEKLTPNKSVSLHLATASIKENKSLSFLSKLEINGKLKSGQYDQNSDLKAYEQNATSNQAASNISAFNATKTMIQTQNKSTHPERSSHNNVKLCKTTDRLYNTTLKYGLKSGIFFDEGMVASFDICIKMCCKKSECNIAFMLKSRCYLVACSEYDKCTPTLSKSSYFSPRIAYVLKSEAMKQTFKKIVKEFQDKSMKDKKTVRHESEATLPKIIPEADYIKNTTIEVLKYNQNSSIQISPSQHFFPTPSFQIPAPSMNSSNIFYFGINLEPSVLHLNGHNNQILEWKLGTPSLIDYDSETENRPVISNPVLATSFLNIKPTESMSFLEVNTETIFQTKAINPKTAIQSNLRNLTSNPQSLESSSSNADSNNIDLSLIFKSLESQFGRIMSSIEGRFNESEYSKTRIINIFKNLTRHSQKSEDESMKLAINTLNIIRKNLENLNSSHVSLDNNDKVNTTKLMAPILPLLLSLNTTKDFQDFLKPEKLKKIDLEKDFDLNSTLNKFAERIVGILKKDFSTNHVIAPTLTSLSNLQTHSEDLNYKENNTSLRHENHYAHHVSKSPHGIPGSFKTSNVLNEKSERTIEKVAKLVEKMESFVDHIDTINKKLTKNPQNKTVHDEEFLKYLHKEINIINITEILTKIQNQVKGYLHEESENMKHMLVEPLIGRIDAIMENITSYEIKRASPTNVPSQNKSFQYTKQPDSKGFLGSNEKIKRNQVQNAASRALLQTEMESIVSNLRQELHSIRKEIHKSIFKNKYGKNDNSIFRNDNEDDFLASVSKSPPPQCSHTLPSVGYTFAQGIKAIEYSSVGKMKTFNECIEHCCQNEVCDIAFMINKHCYLIHCNLLKNCQIVKAKDSVFEVKLAILSRYNERQLMIPTTKITPLNKTSFKIVPLMVTSKVTSTSHPFTKENRNGNENKNKSIIKPEKLLAEFPMLIPTTYIRKTTVLSTAKPFLKKFYTTPTKHTKTFAEPLHIPEPCIHQTVKDGFTLSKGIKAGVFSKAGAVNDFSQCIEKCCQSNTCDIAFMIKRICYKVRCHQTDSCDLVPAFKSEYNPKVVIMKRFTDKLLIKQDNFVPPENNFDLKKLSNFLTPLRLCDHMTPTSGETLASGLDLANYESIGGVENFDRCLEKCCISKCDMALMIDKHCYLIDCSKQDCRLVKTKDLIITISILKRYFDKMLIDRTILEKKFHSQKNTLNYH